MLNSSSHRGHRLLTLTVALFLTTGGTAFPAPIYFHSSTFSPHIFRNYPLYTEDNIEDNIIVDTGFVYERAVVVDGRGVSGFIQRERNGDLVIRIPDAVREKYRIRFFDATNSFLFEVRQIRDPLLILEKYNFQHAGMFQYELYRDNLLIERSSFLIRKD
ncbi:MAG TPA: hypothetical protein VGM30_20720 [Puia sp.]|jgi:hypothetical protein